MMRTALSALAAISLLSTAHAQQGQPRMDVPFMVGERLTYDVKFGPIKVGSGSMEVSALDTVRDRTAWHVTFRVKGGTFFYRVNDVMESWIDTTSFASLRFRQQLEEGGKERLRDYLMFPERAEYTENGGDPLPSVDLPLDDASFLYFVRSLPLTIGETYEFHRYFKPDRNPVRITVVGREMISVPAGTFSTILIKPVIKTKGIFSEDGEARIWLSDDDRRVMVQLKSSLSFGSLNLYLTSVVRPDPFAPPPPPPPESGAAASAPPLTQRPVGR